MTTQIYVAKYVPDPARWEPRNVGVIVSTDGAVACRFVGERAPGVIDGRSIRHSVGAPADVYREWVRFWRRSIVEERLDPESLETAPGSSFFVRAAGEVWLEERPGRPIDDLLTDYFRRLVQDEEPPGVAALKAEVETLLSQTGIAHRPEFRRDVVIQSSGTPSLHREQFHFPYSFENGVRRVGQRVPLGIEALVHDALYRYINLPSDVTAVSFVHGLDEVSQSPAIANLVGLSAVIDVGAPDAAQKLQNLVHS
jgi:hypothetical protein